MKLRAVGRELLVRLDYDLIEEMASKTVIAMPGETIAKMKGGCQVMTILSIGQSAFDDYPPDEAEIFHPGRQVLTGRYPGHAVDTDPLAPDRSVNQHRMISCDEVHAVVVTEDEEGVEISV